MDEQMAARPPVFVLALMGTTPAVLTELLWHLVHLDRLRIVGVEVWTTTSQTEDAGARALGQGWGQIEALRDTLGPEAAALPQLPRRPIVCRPPDGPWDGAPFRLVGPARADGSDLDDIRGPQDAALITGCLHDRLLALRSLDVPLVASLAGGRKTMSAALQVAFAHQARAQDRLVHVLLHPDLEAWLRRERRLDAFTGPSAEWEERTGVPVDEQVSLYTVPVVPVRDLVADRRSADRLELRWDQGLQALMRGLRPEAAAVRVCDDGAGARVELRLGDDVHPVAATREAALAYRAVCRGVGDPQRILRAISEGGGRAPPSAEALRKTLDRLRHAMHDAPIGARFQAFFPRKAQHRWVVDRGEAVDFLDSAPATAAGGGPAPARPEDGGAGRGSVLGGRGEPRDGGARTGPGAPDRPPDGSVP